MNITDNAKTGSSKKTNDETSLSQEKVVYQETS